MCRASTFDTPKKEKRPPRKWRGSKNYGKDVKTTLQVPSCISSGSVRLHASNPNLSTAALGTAKAYPEPPYMDSPIDVAKLQEDFCRVANNLYATMKSALSALTSEKEKLKQVLDHQDTCPPTSPGIMGLKNALSSVRSPPTPLTLSLHCRSSVREN
nr:oxysterol-binding protein-related protein 3-like [Oncorhynchus nerka]